MIVERRKTRRFSGKIGIVSNDEEGLNFSFITDLSRDGAYIQTQKLLEVGAPLMFVLSNNVVDAPIQTRVVRVRDAFFEGGNSGLGVKFENLDGTARVIRDDLLLYLMNLQFQQMWQAA
jgi:Tfp pilus assembly protein PilZ